MRTRRFPAWRSSSAHLLAVTLLGSLFQFVSTPAAPSVSGATPLRVGLMLQTSSISNATDTVTLSGTSGLNVGFTASGSFTTRFSASSPIAVSLDNYYVVVGEYDTLSAAQTMADRVDKLGLSHDIYAESRSGKTVYQVVNGYYETLAQANPIVAKLKQSFGSATLQGYYRLTTGKLSGQSAATQTVANLRAQGFDAYPLTRKDGTWEVWIGNATSTADLTTLRSAIQAKTGVSYATADYSGADYLMIKTSLVQGQQVPHVIIDSDSEEITFQPTGSPAVTRVWEHYNREYRGSIMVQGYHSMPNVINQVPIDQYLYGVLPQEMSSGWPTEALKAQAVASRTYAAKLIGSQKWGVADISDDTYDQAYRGYDREASDTDAAVDATRGEVLVKNGALIDALYSSNNGGYNGDVREMWGGPDNQGIDYLTAVDSSFDKVAADREPLYYRVQLPSGRIGWMRADSVQVSGTNASGFQTGTVVTNGQPVRYTPDLYADVIVNETVGDRVVILDQEKEYNEYNWQRGPYSPTDIMNMIDNNQASGYTTVSSPVYDLHVSQYGQGGRVKQITADGVPVNVPNPDFYRALFDDMWSTRMTIDAQGTYTVMGAGGTTVQYPDAKLQGKTLNVISASGTTTTAINGSNDQFVLLGAGGQSRVVSKNQQYVIHGNGWGHGLGMSQWGAYGMAKNGYTFDQILSHYYQGVTITPKQ